MRACGAAVKRQGDYPNRRTGRVGPLSDCSGRAIVSQSLGSQAILWRL